MPTKPKIFAIWPFTEKVCRHLLECTMLGLGRGDGGAELRRASPRT